MPTSLFQASRVDGQITRRPSASRRIDLLALSIGWFRALQRWIERRRQRRTLRELAEDNEHLLRDIGKSKAEALREAAKPFWHP
jgi:uncharacterized protein YjiS (DUF1127 family)